MKSPLTLLTLTIVLASCAGKSGKEESSATQKGESGFVSVFVNFGDKELAFDSISLDKGDNLYEILMRLETEKALSVQDTAYGDLGHLIVGFEEVVNNGPKYWVYCMNGKKANKGVDLIYLESGDQVNWFYTDDFNICESK